MAIESTFVMVKPDGVRRGLVGEIISRFERKGLTLDRMRMLTIDQELASRHYAEHVDKPFFGELVEFITSGPVIAMQWTGPCRGVRFAYAHGSDESGRGAARDDPRRLRSHHH